MSKISINTTIKQENHGLIVHNTKEGDSKKVTFKFIIYQTVISPGTLRKGTHG